MVFWAIRRQFEQRKSVRIEKGDRKKTNDLYEMSDIETFDIQMEADFLSENKDSLDMAQMAINKAMLTQNNGSKEDSDFMKVSTFLQALDCPISEISRNTGIPRYYVSNLVKQGQQHLKQAIQE